METKESRRIDIIERIEELQDELKELKQELEEIEEDMKPDYPKEDEDRERTMLGEDY